MPTTTSLIWGIHPSGGPPSYLVATMHVCDQRAFGHLSQTVQLMSKVSTFYSEVDLDLLQTQVGPATFEMPNGQTLLDHWTVRKYEKRKKIAQRVFNVNLDLLKSTSPVVSLNQMTLSVLNTDFPLPLDLTLWMKATELGLDLGGLETMDQQLNTLQSLDVAQQVKMLDDALKNVSSFRKKTERLVRFFQNAELHQLYRMTRRDLGSMKRIMVDTRNQVMAQALIKNIRNGPVMAAVGAGHFSGRNGLISLLRKNGLEVRPLEF